MMVRPALSTIDDDDDDNMSSMQESKREEGDDTTPKHDEEISEQAIFVNHAQEHLESDVTFNPILPTPSQVDREFDALAFNRKVSVTESADRVFPTVNDDSDEEHETPDSDPPDNRRLRSIMITVVVVFSLLLALTLGVYFGLKSRNPGNLTADPATKSTPDNKCCSRDGFTCSPDYANLCTSESTCSSTCRGKWITPSQPTGCCSSDGGVNCDFGTFFVNSTLCNNDEYSCVSNDNCLGQWISYCCSTDGSTCNIGNANCDSSSSICSQTCGGTFGPYVQNSQAGGCCSFDMGYSCGGIIECDVNQLQCTSVCQGDYYKPTSILGCCSSNGGQSCDLRPKYPTFCHESAVSCASCTGTFITEPQQNQVYTNTTTTTASDRYDEIKLLLSSSISDTDTLSRDNVTGLALTPQSRALEWVSNLDPRQIPLDNTNELLQRYVLAVLFFSTTALPFQAWKNSSGWLSTASHCNWFGVTCDNANNALVVALKLPNNNLVGPALSHELLVGFGSQLVDLDFRDNQIRGSLPAEYLNSLTSMQTLSLYNNSLTGTIPTTIGSMAALQNVYLERNNLVGSLPDELGNCTQLQRFDAYANQLTGSLPTTLGLLTNLERLWISSNQLNGTLPTQLGNCVSLQQLYLDENHIGGLIPASLANLNKLQDLRAYQNKFNGTLPINFASASSLEIVYLDNNDLSGLVENLMLGPNILELSLFNNSFTGSIPSTLPSSLQVLALSLNLLIGSIPEAMNALNNLSILHLYNNQLSGPIPDFSNMTSLRDVFLQYNQLSGSLPAWLSLLPNIDDVDLSNNNFEGPIPQNFTSSTMRTLRLDGNPRLTGTLPKSLCNATHLQTLLVDCQIQGCYTTCV